jgi:hypothetical protein
LIITAAPFARVNAQPADSTWPHFHGDTKQTGQSKYDTSKVDGSVRWRFKTSGEIETSPAVGTDGTVYIADNGCNLYAITPEGKEKWRFDAGEPVHSIEWGGQAPNQVNCK